MNSTLPPDPYKVLGVTKDAKLPEIRSAHRKLVLKCHPDKVQDAALKAIKQDEFQKVQQAYELLSDDSKRLQYDEQVKLFELRKEMGRGNPTPRSNPFEYEVKTAEPRPSSYGRPKVYSYPTTAPRSNEDLYEEPRHVPRKSASNESAAERKRAAVKEEEMRFRAKMEEDRLRQKERERERERETRRAHSEKKKSKDKDKRRGTEEKVRSRHTYVEDDSSDDEVYRARMERKQRQRMEEEIRIREHAAAAAAQEAARAEAAAREAARKHQERANIKEAPLADKWSEHRDFAGQYMQAARRKAAPVDTDLPVHPGMRRAETFAGSTTPAYNIRYAAPQPQYSDEDMPKRSSATRKESSRRSSETPASRTDKSSRRRSPPAPHPTDPYIVEPPSPTSAPRKASLHTHSSAPPVFTREIPLRSKTEYPRKESTVPPLPRAATFHTADRGRDRPSGSSKLRQEYTSESEPDSPMYHNQQSHSPPRRPQESTREQTQTRYIIEHGRTHPVGVATRSHGAEIRNVDRDPTRERSESPRGTASRPPLSRNPPSSERRGSSRSQSTTYHYQPEVPEPIVLQSERPKFHREGSGTRASSRGAQKASYFDNIQYAPKYTNANVVYSPAAGAAGMYDNVRRGSDNREHDYHTSYHRQGPVYA